MVSRVSIILRCESDPDKWFCDVELIELDRGHARDREFEDGNDHDRVPSVARVHDGQHGRQNSIGSSCELWARERNGPGRNKAI